MTNGTATYFRVAGVTSGLIQSFDLSEPVGTNDSTVVFLATDSSGQEGLFTAPINVPGATNTASGNQPNPTELTELGGTITAATASLQITGLSIHDPINENGQIAFWADTSQGDVILRADPAPSLSVTTANTIDSGGTFGPYLVGVPFKPQFLATVTNDASGSVTGVTYQIDEGAKLNATPSGNHQWSIPYDVGNFTDANSHMLTVATVGSGTPMSMTYTLDMKNSLNYQLSATYPGGPASPEPASQLRFIQGIHVTPTFTGTISDLPPYYANILQVQLSGTGVGPSVTQPSVNIQSTPGTAGAQFTFQYDAVNLPVGNTSVELTFPGPNGAAFAPGAPAPALDTIPLPTWMGTPKREVFITGPEIAAALPAQGAGYAIDVSLGNISGSDALPLTANTPGFLGTLFNNFSGSLGTTLTLTVYATLEPTAGEAKLELSNWTVQASVLNNPLFAQAKSLLSQAGVSASVNLNPQTLDEPSQLVISATNLNLAALLNPSKTFFNLPFNATKTFTVPVPIGILHFFGITAGVSVGLQGTFQATVDTVTANAQITIDLGSDGPAFDPASSYVMIAATGNATLNFTVTGSIVLGTGLFSFLPGVPNQISLAEGHITGEVSAAVNAKLQLDLSGALLAPSFKFDTNKSYATALVSYDIGFNDAPDPEDAESIPITLFGNPPMANLDDSDGLQPTGPETTGNPGYPGVSPTNGNTFDQEGPATGADPAATPDVAPGPVGTGRIVTVAASAPTATLTVLQPIDAPVSSLSFDLNVLADHAALTAGHHFLDFVLVDPSGNQVSLADIDLSTMALAANDNPLGYASGWTTIKATPAAGALSEGTPYQLEFLLTNDLAGTGQAVAVALDNLRVSQPSPQLGISDSPSGGAPTGPLVFGAGTVSATVNLSNPGAAPVIVNSVSIAGAGFTLPNGPTGPFTLEPGDVVPVEVQLLDPTQPASAALQITSDDSNEPLYVLPLQYQTTTAAPLNYPPVPAPIPDQRVSPGGTVTFNSLGDQPGRRSDHHLQPRPRCAVRGGHQSHQRRVHLAGAGRRGARGLRCDRPRHRQRQSAA